MPHRKHKKKMRERFLTDEEFRHLGEVLNEIETSYARFWVTA